MKRLLPILLFLSFQSGVVTASDKPKPEGVDLIRKAEAKMNIFALPAFVMKADLVVDLRGKAVAGKYALLWGGPERWREEISFPDYTEVQVGSKGVVAVKRSGDLLPLRVEQIHTALGFGSGRLDPGSFFDAAPETDESANKVKERKVNGTKADCVEITGPDGRSRHVCVDQATGVIVREHPFRDDVAMPIGDRMFPRGLKFVDERRTLVEIRVTEFETGVPLADSAFVVPAGAVSQPGCMNPTQSHKVHKVEPRYPESAKQEHISGDVSVYARIGTDGVPRQLRVVSGASGGLDEASVYAIRGWRYAPATCSGIPVEIETVLTIKYRLGP